MAEGPDRLFIDEGDRELYKKVAEEGVFKGKNNKEQFMFAMAMGVKNSFKISINKKDGWFFVKDLHPEDMSLINAVAILVTGSITLLSSKKDVYKIAEEYARGGIRLLADKIQEIEFGTFWKHFEQELFEQFPESTESLASTPE
jgi:hypothetical protein